MADDEIKIIKRKELPDDAVIAGKTFLKYNEKKQDFEVNVSNGHLVSAFEMKKKKVLTRVKGYVEVDGKPNTYLEVRKHWFLIIILFFILLGIILGLIFGLRGCGNTADDESTLPSNDFDVTGENWDGEMPGNSDKVSAEYEEIEMPGYQLVWVDKDNQTVNLINPNDNVYLMYEFIYDGETVGKSDYIDIESSVDYNFYKLFSEEGEYVLTFQIHSYDTETKAECNGVTETVTLKVY